MNGCGAQEPSGWSTRFPAGRGRNLRPLREENGALDAASALSADMNISGATV